MQSATKPSRLYQREAVIPALVSMDNKTLPYDTRKHSSSRVDSSENKEQTINHALMSAGKEKTTANYLKGRGLPMNFQAQVREKKMYLRSSANTPTKDNDSLSPISRPLIRIRAKVKNYREMMQHLSVENKIKKDSQSNLKYSPM